MLHIIQTLYATDISHYGQKQNDEPASSTSVCLVNNTNEVTNATIITPISHHSKNVIASTYDTSIESVKKESITNIPPSLSNDQANENVLLLLPSLIKFDNGMNNEK